MQSKSFDSTTFNQTKIIVFVSTVIRNTNNKKLTGLLYKIDWEKSQIINSIAIPVEQEQPLWNERGGNRGGRGVYAHNGKLYLATATSILVYDYDLNKIGEVRNELFAGLHEIVCSRDGMWVTSTIHDLLLKTDYSGKVLFEWWGSESSVLQKEFNYKSRELNVCLAFKNNFTKSYEKYIGEERLHLNAVAEYKNAIYILASRKNAVIRIYPEPEKIIIKDSSLGAPHNCLLTETGQVLINDTRNQLLKIYNSTNGEMNKSINTKLSPHVNRSEQFNTGGWQRGLAQLSENEYLIGTSPAAIFLVNTLNDSIGKTISLDTDINHCVHGLHLERIKI